MFIISEHTEFYFSIESCKNAETFELCVVRVLAGPVINNDVLASGRMHL